MKYTCVHYMKYYCFFLPNCLSNWPIVLNFFSWIVVFFVLQPSVVNRVIVSTVAHREAADVEAL